MNADQRRSFSEPGFDLPRYFLDTTLGIRDPAGNESCEDRQAKELAQLNAERAVIQRRFGHLRQEVQNEPTADPQAASEAAKGHAA